MPQYRRMVPRNSEKEQRLWEIQRNLPHLMVFRLEQKVLSRMDISYGPGDIMDSWMARQKQVLRSFHRAVVCLPGSNDKYERIDELLLPYYQNWGWLFGNAGGLKLAQMGVRQGFIDVCEDIWYHRWHNNCDVLN